jgi:diaminopimelate epimerase
MMIAFEKLVGAGNDFVFLAQQDLPEAVSPSKLAKKICNRNSGVGADGLVILHQGDEKTSFVWDFYNQDGSSAEMCGNAARCCVLYIHQLFGIDECEIQTLAGTVKGVFTPGHIEVSWSIPSDKMVDLSIDLESFKTFNGQFINTGVPHFVLTNQLGDVTLEDCQELQKHPKFAPEQTNVTFLDTDENGVYKTKTFERGVKNFTLACGTGVIASAFVLQAKQPADIYHLRAPGGKLSVKIDGPHVTLIGPAQRTFNGHYQLTEDANV